MPEMPLRTRTLRWLLAAGLMALAFSGSQGHADADADAEQAILSTFEQISQVPRCSKDEARISAWLVEWARSRGLAVSSDAHKNVLITLPATAGREASPGVILQSHMDMVCLKTEGSTHDFTMDPIPVIRDGDWVHAKDTTLGADNGIGIAIALTIAESPPESHPKLELLFTTDEEKDMTGIAGLRDGILTGRRFVNLDSETDDVVTLGAAGGVHTDIALPLAMGPLPAGMNVFVLKISGLLGGHSGVDIDKNRPNANVLAAQLLAGAGPFRLVSMSGGSAGNAIATSAELTLAVEPDMTAALHSYASGFIASTKEQYPQEEGLTFTLSEAPNAQQQAASPQDSAAAMRLITAIPQGVTAWSQEFAQLPETSNNIGIVSSVNGTLNIATFQRSFHAEELDAIARRIADTATAAGASSSRKGLFPAWPPNSSTGLYRAVTETYSKLFGSAMTTEVIHAGLECGYIAKKYPAMEIVSIGPTLEDVHTTRERLKVASLPKVWKLIHGVLQTD